MPKTIVSIPKQLLGEILEAGQLFRNAEESLEDFLLTSDFNFVKKMRRLRSAHRRGKLGSWQKMKTRYGL